MSNKKIRCDRVALRNSALHLFLQSTHGSDESEYFTGDLPARLQLGVGASSLSQHHPCKTIEDAYARCSHKVIATG
jgi:hypothetical protein